MPNPFNRKRKTLVGKGKKIILQNSLFINSINHDQYNPSENNILYKKNVEHHHWLHCGSFAKPFSAPNHLTGA
jgi:hypothetical protein